MIVRTRQDLQQLQALPLHLKIELTKSRIRQWINEFGESGVYISFSGGKDSTVLSHIVDTIFPENEIPRVFFNTGLEYPEIVEFVKNESRTVVIRPKMNFKQVINRYGYPFISKEVSECVCGAKKYLDRLDRQTDRQTDTIFLLLQANYRNWRIF